MHLLYRLLLTLIIYFFWQQVTSSEQKLRLLLLLGGQKLRAALSELGGGGGAGEEADYNRAVGTLGAHFRRRGAARAARYSFFYGSAATGGPLPGERPRDWRRRLMALAAAGCDFVSMTESEAAVLVMARHCCRHSRALREQVLSGGVSPELAFQIMEQAAERAAAADAAAMVAADAGGGTPGEEEEDPTEHVMVEMHSEAEGEEEDGNEEEEEEEDTKENGDDNSQEMGTNYFHSLHENVSHIYPPSFTDIKEEGLVDQLHPSMKLPALANVASLLLDQDSNGEDPLFKRNQKSSEEMLGVAV